MYFAKIYHSLQTVLIKLKTNKDAGIKTIHLEGEKLKKVLSIIKFYIPTDSKNKTASMLTGELRLDIKSSKVKAIYYRKFKIYNGKILNNAENTNITYQTIYEIKYSDY